MSCRTAAVAVCTSSPSPPASRAGPSASGSTAKPPNSRSDNSRPCRWRRRASSPPPRWSKSHAGSIQAPRSGRPRRPIAVGTRSSDCSKSSSSTPEDGPGRSRPTAAKLTCPDFSALLNEDYVTASPVVGIERPAKENVRDRILGDDEIRAFWRATDDLPAPFNDIYKLLLLSCARRQEVAEARWGEVDLINKVWVISAKRAKGKAAVALPLGPLAWSIIERQPRIAGSDYVFGRRRCGFSHMKRQLDAIMKPTVQWQNHDLRRSGRSLLSKARVPADISELMLGHVLPGNVRRIYDRFEYLGEKRAGFAALEREINRIINPPDADVIPLRALTMARKASTRGPKVRPLSPIERYRRDFRYLYRKVGVEQLLQWYKEDCKSPPRRGAPPKDFFARLVAAEVAMDDLPNREARKLINAHRKERAMKPLKFLTLHQRVRMTVEAVWKSHEQADRDPTLTPAQREVWGNPRQLGRNVEAITRRLVNEIRKAKARK